MRIKFFDVSSFLLAAVLAACAGQQAPSVPAPIVAPDSVSWSGDPDVAPVLTKALLSPALVEDAERVAARIGFGEFTERLAGISEDTTAPWLVRVNALKLLAVRGAVEQLPVFVSAMRSPEEVIRISAVSTMRNFMAAKPAAATQFLVAALKDPSPRVQTAALEILGDRDVPALRAFYARSTSKEIRGIALDLIRAAEDRGAPLVEKDSTGTLERTTATGATLTFRPTTRWPQWDAAVGEVSVKLPGGKPAVVAAGVEAVGKVVPAFFTPDGKTLVYEVNREIHARALTTGADRMLAVGIAPRILPFSSDVIYMNELPAERTRTPNSTSMKFEVKRLSLTSDSATSVGTIAASALNDLKGNYATVRWSRISENEGTFLIVGDRIKPFKLPSPFGE